MARTTPAVQGDKLVWREGNESRSITIGTPPWYEWLNKATVFSFSSPNGAFTGRKERFQRGGFYWKAYRGRSGKLHSAYLGKAESLTLDRLNEVAAALLGRNQDDGAAPIATPSKFQPESVIVSTPNKSLFTAELPRSPHQDSDIRQSDSLISTKFSVPPDRPELVARPRLIALLHEGARRKLTLLSAPPGSGKTALLSHWSYLTMCSVAWVSLSTEDNDPIRFWSYIVAALQTQRPSLGSDALTMLRSSQPPPVEAILANLINALSAESGNWALVLDDYHVIGSATVHAGMTFLLDHLPPNAHVIISSRIDPPLPLAGLRGKGQLKELRADDLGFTLEETAVYLSEVMRLDLSTEDVTVLENRTEGWIAGVQLAALSLRQREDAHAFIRSFAGDHRHIFDYLVEEVLRRQPESVQTFLLQTSILDRLSGPLCEAISPCLDGQGMLEMLERDNLFTVPLDDERRWYRYHNLFADALRALLHRTQPNRVRELHRRASVWFVEHGLASEGVSHALAAHEYDFAAGLVEQIGPAMVKRQELTPLVEWFKAFPEDVVRERPACRLLQAWVFAATGQVSAAEALLQDMERDLMSSADAVSEPGRVGAPERTAEIERVLADIAIVRATIADYLGDSRSELALSQQVLDLSLEKDPTWHSQILRNLGSAYWRSGDVEGATRTFAEASTISQAAGDVSSAAVSLSQLAGLQIVKGRLREASANYEQAIRIVEGQGGQSLMGAGAPFVGLAWLQYEWNDLDTAAHNVTKGVELSEQANATFFMLRGYGVLARVKQGQGDLDGAHEVLRQAEQLARTSNLTYHSARLATYKVRLWLAQGNLEAAVNWAEALGLGVDGELSYHKEAEFMTLARVRIAQDKGTEAAGLLVRLLQAAETTGRVGSVIKILALRSVALRACGDPNQALAMLEQALLLAEPERYVRSFIDLGPPMAAQLCKAIEVRQTTRWGGKDQASLDYLRKLLSAFGSQEKPPEGDPNEVGATLPYSEPLSERELQVLHLIAAGRSASDIARTLFVAVSTVRTHVQNIYSKLSAHNRIQALSRARELGLLP